jgi:hypothetical protein
LVEFKKCLELKPDLGETHFHLGVVFRNKSWWDEAIQEFQKFVDSPNPDQDMMAQAIDQIQQVRAWKQQLQVSPSADTTKIIK